MEHLIPTEQEKAERLSVLLAEKRIEDRKNMRNKFLSEHPPMNDKEKQEALKDRMKLIKTMDMARGMIDKKFKPMGQAQSLSPYLLANAVGFDSVKIINKLEADRQVRVERKLKIAEEIKREQAIAHRQRMQREEEERARAGQGGHRDAEERDMSRLQVDDDMIARQQIKANIAMFGEVLHEDPEERAAEERKRKIDAYFATLDPKKRQWEEKKLEHYRGTGKTYLLPGEKAEKDRRKALT